jgi:hypothetical protein
MELWAHINGKDYPVANGANFSDELSETLDGGSICLPHVFDILDIKPYDDVIIHDFGEGKLPNRKFHTDFYKVIKNGVNAVWRGHFYRHMLVESFTREQTNLHDTRTITREGKSYVTHIFNYNITLISETRGLENAKLPNRTITQPKGTTESLKTSDSEYATLDNYGYSLAINGNNDPRNGERYLKWSDNDNDFLDEHRQIISYTDFDGATLDYCNYSAIKKKIKTNSEFYLPDLRISGIVNAHYYIYRAAFQLNWRLKEYEILHPKKYWFAVKDDSWGREYAINAIRSYINNKEYPSSLICLGESEDGISNITAKFDSEGTYYIYLYCTAKARDFRYHYVTFNPMRMKTQDGNESYTPYFLVRWKIDVSDDATESRSVITVYEAMRQLIELYSPYIKVTADGKIWSYQRKYVLSDDMKSFKNKTVPEQSFNLPTLRECLTRILQSQDCLPVVHDGVISCVSLSKRGKPFNDVGISWLTKSMDGSQYCDKTLRNYTSALSRDSVTRCVERVGFRNSNTSVMTLSNLQLELTHPIYKIKSIHMCYYKKLSGGSYGDKMFLCRQDITPLVKLESERNLLSVDWTDTDSAMTMPSTVKGYNSSEGYVRGLADYKFYTVGYSIGSNIISGWGTMLTTPLALFWKKRKTYIENIFDWFESKYPQGSDNYSLFSVGDSGTYQYNYTSIETISNVDSGASFSGLDDDETTNLNNIIFPNSEKGFWSNKTMFLRTLMFEVEYDGFINANIQSTKDKHDGNVIARDNQSSSLSYMESDGINQKEKVNRLGNATVQATARITLLDDMQDISSVWDDDVTSEQEKVHDDEVLYRRSFSVSKDYITVNYYLCEDYVLRNYFTSVYSRERPFALSSYGDSIERNENRSLQILMSPDVSYYQKESKQIKTRKDVLEKIFSFYKASTFNIDGNLQTPDKVNLSYLEAKKNRYNTDGYAGYFAMDNQIFTSGNSMCFVVSMIDSVSNGVFISDYGPSFGEYISQILKNLGNYFSYENGGISDEQAKALNDITGCKQEWYMLQIDPKTGFLYKMSFSVANFDYYGDYAIGGILDYSESASTRLFESARKLPFMDINIRETGESYSTYDADDDYYEKTTSSNPLDNSKATAEEFASAVFCAHENENDENEADDVVFKDGKEKMSVTLQFEPISEDDRIMFSDYMMKLSDVLSVKEKRYEDMTQPPYIVVDIGMWQSKNESLEEISTTTTNKQLHYVIYSRVAPYINLSVPSGYLSNLSNDYLQIGKTIEWGSKDSSDRYISVTLTKIGNYQYINSMSRYALMAHISFTHIWTTSANVRIEETKDIEMYLFDLSENESVPSQDLSSSIPMSNCIKSLGGNDTLHFVGIIDDFFKLRDSEKSNRRMYYALGGSAGGDGTAMYDKLDAYFPIERDVLESHDYFLNIYQEYGRPKNGKYRYLYANCPNSQKEAILYPVDAKSTTITRNMYWGIFSPLCKETPYEELTALDIANLTTIDDISIKYGLAYQPYLSIKKTGIMTPCSIRLYYFEDDAFHFVFGFNAEPSIDDGGDSARGVIPENGEYRIYLSLLDNRSRKVLDYATGEYDYVIKDINSITSSTYPYYYGTETVVVSNEIIQVGGKDTTISAKSKGCSMHMSTTLEGSGYPLVIETKYRPTDEEGGLSILGTKIYNDGIEDKSFSFPYYKNESDAPKGTTYVTSDATDVENGAIVTITIGKPDMSSTDQQYKHTLFSNVRVTVSEKNKWVYYGVDNYCISK